MFSLIKEITYKVSSYCNLDCVYCFQTKEIKERNDIFTDFDALACFLSQLPFRDSLEIKLTGGEVSLFLDEMRYGIRELKKLERKQDLKMNFTVITNGTNMEGIIDMMDEGLLEPDGTKLSWDGIYSASRSRKPKNPLFTDEFFNSKIRLLGKSKYNKSVLVRTAVTPDTVDDLYEAVLYLLDIGCTKWEYYFLTECEAYKSQKFAEQFHAQLQMIIGEYCRRYHNRQNRWTFSNWDSLYFVDNVRKTTDNKQRSVSCRHLGRSLYIAYDGRIFPCGYFDPYSNCDYTMKNGAAAPYVLGDIHTGFNEKAVCQFIDDYMHAPSCDYLSCNNLHCFECPALNKARSGQLNARNCQTCVMRSMERRAFELRKGDIRLSEEEQRMFADRYDFVQDWNFERLSTGNYHQLPLRKGGE